MVMRGQENDDCHGCGDVDDGCSIPATAVQKPVMDRNYPCRVQGRGFRGF